MKTILARTNTSTLSPPSLIYASYSVTLISEQLKVVQNNLTAAYTLYIGDTTHLRASAIKMSSGLEQKKESFCFTVATIGVVP
jgi:hypothetical protein